MPIAVGRMVRPAVVVDDARSGRTRRVPWVPDGVNLLVFPHPTCQECAAFLRRISAEAGRFADWGVRLRAVGSDPAHTRELVDELDCEVLDDPEGRLHRAVEVIPTQAAVVVLDVHGQVYYSRDLDGHEMPLVDDLFQEARFPALQCPECDTPDVPSQSFPLG